MPKPKIAGVDAGQTLIKACWKEDELFVFASTADMSTADLRAKLDAAGITRLHLGGIGDASPVLDGFETLRPTMPSIPAEIQMQVDGAKRLLAMTGPGGEDTFFLVSIGSGTSYTFVHEGVATQYPFGNPDSGTTLDRLAGLLGYAGSKEIIRLAENGEHLDLLMQDRMPELKGTFLGDLVLSHFGKAVAGSSHEDIAATFLHKLAVQTVRGIHIIGDTKAATPFQKVFFIGSLVGRSPKFREYLWDWTPKIGKTPMYHGWGEYALALGAYHMTP